MRPKQQEMDGIVHQVYNALESLPHLRSTLLVLCGDHGMNDAGNHGGSTVGETSSALVFISPIFRRFSSGVECPAGPTTPFQYFDFVEQSDIVPTLATLLGFPIPMNNVGVLIPNFLRLWQNQSERLALLDRNIDQMSRVLLATFGEEFNPASAACGTLDASGHLLACQLASIHATDGQDTSSPKAKISARLSFLRNAQKTLGRAATEYNIPSLHKGLAVGIILMITAYFALRSMHSPSSSTTFWASSVIFSQAASVFSSSFVEEEHHVWYWLSRGWIAWLYIASSRRPPRWLFLVPLALLCSARIESRWNQTGQKHSGDPDIAKVLLSGDPSILLALASLVYLGVVAGFWQPRVFPFDSQKANVAAGTALVLVAAIFKITFMLADSPELLPMLDTVVDRSAGNLPLVLLSRIVFVGIVGLLASSAAQAGSGKLMARRQKDLHLRAANTEASKRHAPKGLRSVCFLGLVIFLITQTRVHNLPLYILFAFDAALLRHLSLGSGELAITLTILQHASFFAFGGSNSMSSIDLSNAYNGVDSFNVVAVGCLVFASNWAGPIWWTCTLVSELPSRDGYQWRLFLAHAAFMGFVSMTSNVAVMLACNLFRTHLFIWTVFSPKYLFSIAWSVGQYLIIDIGVGLLAFCIAAGEAHL